MQEIRAMAERGGPEPSEYARLRAMIDEGAEDMRAGRVDRSVIGDYFRSLGPEFMNDSMQGFGLLKPYGYTGDFEIIDRMYTMRVSTNPSLTRWDMFYHDQSSPRAVRNRAIMFGEYISATVERLSAGGAVAKVLDVASGPARDVAWWLDANPTANAEIECVEKDPRAIVYAKSIIDRTARGHRVQFIQRDVLHYRTDKRFDLIWSAGLFDYLSDRLFVRLLRRLISMLAPGGMLAVGNFSSRNTSRNWMELFGEWYMGHRDGDELSRLARDAGASNVEIVSEAQGIQLFAVVRA